MSKIRATTPDGDEVKVKAGQLKPKAEQTPKRQHYYEGGTVNGVHYDAGWYAQQFWLWTIIMPTITSTHDDSSNPVADYSTPTTAVSPSVDDSPPAPSYSPSHDSSPAPSFDSGSSYGGGFSGGD